MLNFDKKHSYIDGNINKKDGKKVLKKIIVGGLVVGNLFTFSGCAKDVECPITGNHAHFYFNSDSSLGRYIVSEKSHKWSLERQDDYIPVNEEEIKLLNYMDRWGLYRIDENRDAINNITSKINDYIEYSYSVTSEPGSYLYHNRDGTVFTVNAKTHSHTYSWTTDTTKNLTGAQRLCHFVYYGYKIVKNDKGEYRMIESDPVDDLSQLPEGFDYITSDFCDIEYSYDLREILNFIDRQNEEKQSQDEIESSKTKTR